MRLRAFTVGLLAAVIALALAAGPVAASTKSERKQDRAIRSLTKKAKSASKQLRALRSDAGAAKGALAGLDGTVGSLRSGLDSAAAGVRRVSDGLAALKTALTGYAAATEYGVVQLYFDPEGNGFEPDDAIPAQLLTSADVPDDTNQATLSGKLMLRVPDGTTAKPVALKAGMRSGERDGTSAANPVGVAGLMAMTASIVGAAGTTSVGGGNPGSTSLPLTSAPNAALGGKPVYDIPDKAPRTDVQAPLAFPDGKTIELTDPATLQTVTGAPTRFTVTNTSGADAMAVFDITVRFHDLSASATDLEE